MLKRMMMICVLFFFLLWSFSAYPAEAANYHYNARAYALGGAYTGIADDFTAIYYNPAGLAHSGAVGLGFGAGIGMTGENILPLLQLIPHWVDLDEDWEMILEKITVDDATDGDYGGFAGIRFGSLGFGVGIEGRGTIEFEGDDPKVDAQHITTYNLAYAYRVLDPFANIGALSVGLNLKYMQGQQVEYSAKDPWSDDYLTDLEGGFGADLGLMFKLSDMINLGIKIENVYSDVDWGDGNLPTLYNVGAGIQLPFVGTSATVDIGNRANDNGTIMRAGLEQSMFGIFDLRGGMVIDGTNERMYTGGLGINLGPIKADMGLGIEDFDFSKISGVFGIRANF